MQTNGVCRWRCWGWFLMGAFLFCALGCAEGEPCSVKGQVTHLGKPIEEGNIRFLTAGETPGPGGSAKITNGSYEVPAGSGMCAGSYTVAISATREPTEKEAAAMKRGEDDEPEEGEEGEAAAPVAPRRVQYLPEKYSMGQELKADLAPGENTKDFNLD